jgi:hypothetical protein
MVARVHTVIWIPQHYRKDQRSCDGEGGAGGGGGKGQSSIDFIYFWGRIRSSVGRGNESKKRYGRAREAKTH